ncbi:MAG: dTDP-4-amino-4,6-dideoxygalactose transaminase [Cyclobacteriaceae bacterium]|nr:dTDP-4-amino-4,6-dideoxygalactose transaminase [Cyclobacteriaceae bacterium]
MIPFNKPYSPDSAIGYIKDAINSGHLSGNGKYTRLCHDFFQSRFGFNKCLLTSSGTDALEMAAILAEINPGDEVIVPSYTFVSTANAFVLRGSKIVFVDSRSDHPGMDEEMAIQSITARTKAIVLVHYAGVACNMDIILKEAEQRNIKVIEDAAHSVDSFYIDSSGTKVPLGSLGHFSAFSFHETKNIHCGEGGMLVVNDDRYNKRAEIVWEKGTNRAAFWRGEIDKYGWVDIGSSYLPSEITAAFLYAQLEVMNSIQDKRKELWKNYFEGIYDWAKKNSVRLPFIPPYAVNNAHIFYLIFPESEMRTRFINHLKNHGIFSAFHYQGLHQSIFFKKYYDGPPLKNSEFYSDCLVRLPMYFDLSFDQQNFIIETIRKF